MSLSETTFETEPRSKIVVAMSGGVDSSVAALILKRAGYDIIGVSMQVWDYRNGGSKSRATCCAPSDFNDARRVASTIGMPYYVFDFEHSFREKVIQKFVDTYQRGETPNPCIDCNSKVKFAELRSRVESFGFNAVATGHYAQVVRDESRRVRLLRSVDTEKDQSYFLYGLTIPELEKTYFPIGQYSKAEVREIARAGGLATADKAESMDICFVSEAVPEFVVKIGGRKGTAGSYVSSDGKILGQHDGVHSFTVGQRRGLKIATVGQPLYVTEIRPETGDVVVGSKKDLERESFTVHELNWISPLINQTESLRDFSALAQLRHRSKAVPVKVSRLDSERVTVNFAGEWTTVTPGQACVFYDLTNKEVLGGGRIARG